MQEFLESLGINEEVEEQDGKVVLKLNDSNEFQDMFEYLQGVDSININEDSVEFDNEHNKVTFEGDKYNVTLNADFENEKYELKVEK